jgi:hypothetical protein
MIIVIAKIPLDVKVQWEVTCARFDSWLRVDVFRFKWWVLLALFLICLYLWWKTVDKSRLNEIILYSALIIILIIVLDELGEELTLWDYPVDLFPLFPPMSAVNLSCMPVVYSVIYQYFRSWKSFILASFVMSAIFCFIGEPLFVWSGVYQMIKWKGYYGLPVYIAIAIIGKSLVIKIYSFAKKN